MKLLLKHQRAINGQHLKAGEHELPDEMLTHWYIQALVKEGNAIITREETGMKAEPKPEPKGDENHANKELAKKLDAAHTPAKHGDKPAPAESDESFDGEELDGEDLDLDDADFDDSEESSEEPESSDKPKAHKKKKNKSRNHKGN